MATKQTTREQYAALVEQLRTDEAEAMPEILDLFSGAEMGTLLDRITALQTKTIPGGHWDQLLGSTLSVLTSMRNTTNQVKETDKVASADATTDGSQPTE